MQDPVDVPLFFLANPAVNRVLVVFLAPAADVVEPLAFAFHSSIIENERPFRGERFAVQHGERDVALVDVYVDNRLGVHLVWFLKS